MNEGFGMDSFRHPSTRIASSYSNLLEGKKIALGITGSVAAFLSPQIARELMRHGADVIPVMTKESLTMVGKNLMWWATGNEPITEVTGELEHISMAGVMNKPIDLMLIAPSTTNTVAKISTGIADTPVSLIASSINGKGIPLQILAVAHEDLINSPPIQKHILALKEMGVHFIDPVLSEGKAKVPDLKDIMFEIFELLIPKSMEDKTVIVTGGPTRSYIDNVRFISNDSSGKTGIDLARIAHYRGAKSILVSGPISTSIPRGLETRHVISSQDMADEVLGLLEQAPDAIVILSAAMADFKIKEVVQGKIKSGKDLEMQLEPTIKLSDHVKVKFPQSKLVLFKAEWDTSAEELIELAKKKLHHCDADYIVANDLSRPDSGFQTSTNNVFIIDKNDAIKEFSGSKLDMAQEILDLFIE